MKLKNTIAAVALMAAGSAAYAVPVTWNFSDYGVGPLGTSAAFLSSPSALALTAYGYSPFWPGGGPKRLFFKADTPSETGLGLFPGGDNEIAPPFASIELAMPSGLSHFTITIGSAQSGEHANIYECTDLSCTTSKLEASLSGHNNPTPQIVSAPVWLDAGYTVFAIVDEPRTGVNGDNVLLQSLTTTSVPEPAIVGLLGFGLIGVAVARRRSK